MVAKDQKEKRDYVRAVISIRAKVKLIDPDEFDEIRNRKNLISTVLSECEPGGARSTDAPTTQGLFSLFTYMMQMDEKLDRILTKLEGEQVEESRFLTVDTKDISGSGVSMMFPDSIEIGQLVYITMIIPNVAAGFFNMCGEVVRSRQATVDGKTMFDTGIKFIDITEDERERLIACSFSQQRESIRKLKDIQ